MKLPFLSPPAATRSTGSRDYSFDNIRGFLIICVVLGHFLEVCPMFKGSHSIYRVIYSFHMPAFIFLTGYFAHFSRKKIVFSWFVPYLVFQTIYILFDNAVYHTQTPLQYTTPHWILWYLLTGTFYQALVPLYDKKTTRHQLTCLICVFFIAIAVGYDSTVGYYASLSRFLVHQPWFVLGLYCRRYVRKGQIPQETANLYVSVFSAVAVLLSVLGVYLSGLSEKVMFGSYSYASLGYTPLVRIAVMLVALVWIVLLMYGLRPLTNRRIFLLTYIGQNTLPVFLLHGLVVKVVPHFYPQLISSPIRVGLLTIAVVLLFGNRFCNGMIRLITFDWLKKYI